MKEYTSGCVKVAIPEIKVIQKQISKKIKGKRKYVDYLYKINSELNYLYGVILLNSLFKNTELTMKIEPDKLCFIYMKSEGDSFLESETLFSIPLSQVYFTKSNKVKQTTVYINLDNEVDIIEPA